MAVLGLSSQIRGPGPGDGDGGGKKEKAGGGRGHGRKLSGVFSSFLDAFRCHVAQAGVCNEQESEKGKAKAKPRLKLLLLQQQQPPPQEGQQEGEQEHDAGPAISKVRADYQLEVRDRSCKVRDGDEHGEDKAVVVASRSDPTRRDREGPNDKSSSACGGSSGRRMGLRWLVEGVKSGRKEEERLRAAAEMRRMSRDSSDNRVVLAELGVIPSLVDLLDSTSSSPSACKQPLLALLNLAIGNSRNKQWIVEAGAVPILVRLLSSGSAASAAAADVVESATAALLSLSALDSNKPIIGHSGAAQQLVRILRSKRSSSSSIKDSTRVLYNLSISSANVGRMVADGAADALLNLLNTDVDGDALVADRILATLGNLAELSEEARKCLTSSAAIAKLLTALASYTATMEETSSSSSSASSSSASASSGSEEDSSSSQAYTLGPAAKVARCQERVLYVLMLLTHHSWPARQAMVSAGAVTPLLEVALLGTAIAQRRAARILDCLREERFQRNASRPMSAPLALPLAASSRMVQAPKVALCEERRAVNWMVKQSLERNMEKMVRRARLPSEDLDVSSRMTISSKLNRSFGSSSSSKALLSATSFVHN